MNTSSYPRSFELAVAFVLEMEGGFVNDPDDPGGVTCYGISQRAYPDVDIRGLTIEQSKAIYYRDYWQRCRCDELPPMVAAAVFDGAVNMGRSASVKCLQRALDWVLSRPVLADGVIGSKTLAAAGVAEPPVVLSTLLAKRAEYYHRLTVLNHTRQRFLFGWLRRCFELQRFIEKEFQVWH